MRRTANRLLSILALLFLSPRVFAYPCPSEVASRPQLTKMHSWISAISKQSSLGDCHVEISVCDLTEVVQDGNGMMAEFYVQDGQGREVYVPIMAFDDLSAPPTERIKIEMFRYRLKYTKHDYLFEEEFGRTEGYQLDVRLDRTTGAVRRLDVGTYATRKKLRMPNGNQSRWYNCKAPST